MKIVFGIANYLIEGGVNPAPHPLVPSIQRGLVRTQYAQSQHAVRKNMLYRTRALKLHLKVEFF